MPINVKLNNKCLGESEYSTKTSYKRNLLEEFKPISEEQALFRGTLEKHRTAYTKVLWQESRNSERIKPYRK